MIQTPAPQTFVQQLMPYLVMLCVTVITCLIGLVKVYADKLIAQLQANKQATEEAGDSAKAAVTISASNALALANHASVSGAKLDAIVEQTNGINQALTAQVADQKQQISNLTNKPV